jgi:HAD superfamily hydrolase (TIGR01509 family)
VGASAAGSRRAATGLAAVLFDMDGTLLDSEWLWDTALRALATHHGGVLSEAARLAMVGRNTTDSMLVFYQDLGLTQPDPVTDNGFVFAQMVELFATRLSWRPGAAELLGQVRRAGVPTALVTSTDRRLVEVALASLLGEDTFDVMVCGNDVARPKPDPEPYRTAAERLRVPIGRCVAIEDSPAGLASASAAGAVVLGVRGEVPLAGVDGAQLVDSLTEVDLSTLEALARGGRRGGGYLAAK